jgi:peroxiredoxin
LGVRIVGVGFQDPGTNDAWIQDQGYQFEVWTDDDRALSVAYGAASSASAFFPDRVTVLLDANGDLLLEYTTVNIDVHPQQVLDDCALLFDSAN